MVRRIRSSSLTHRPTVTVVVPCYRYGHFLPSCVESVLSQADVEVDVIVVDDAPPDDSAAVARGLARDPRVQVIEHATNQGHIATYNDGLDAASGEYVALLSADDVLAPGSLSRAAALLDVEPTVGLVYGHCPAFADVPPAGRTVARSSSVWAGPEWIESLCGSVTNPVYTPGVVMRTSAFSVRSAATTPGCRTPPTC